MLSRWTLTAVAELLTDNIASCPYEITQDLLSSAINLVHGSYSMQKVGQQI